MIPTTPPSTTPNGTPVPIRRIGRFSISESLGKGSNGTIFLGHDPVIDRDVAIKVLSNSVGLADKKQREQQFINEARAAGRLSHPNIVTIYDASSEGGTTFIAMEFLQGKDLRELMASGKRFDIIEIANIICKVAEALAYAHEHSVIHRDIKPANIFILPNKQPKVVDFGIARTPNRVLDDKGNPGETLFNNNILGTPNYMSREQALGQAVTASTDIYSLGAVMYEMLTLQKPFQSHDIDKLLHQIANKTPKSPMEISSKIPERLSQIAMKAMQKDPSARYKTATEMAEALQKFLARDLRLKRKRQPLGTQSSNETQDTSKKSTLFWLSCIAILIAAAVLAKSLLK